MAAQVEGREAAVADGQLFGRCGGTRMLSALPSTGGGRREGWGLAYWGAASVAGARRGRSVMSPQNVNQPAQPSVRFHRTSSSDLTPSPLCHPPFPSPPRENEANKKNAPSACAKASSCPRCRARGTAVSHACSTGPSWPGRPRLFVCPTERRCVSQWARSGMDGCRHTPRRKGVWGEKGKLTPVDDPHGWLTGWLGPSGLTARAYGCWGRVDVEWGQARKLDEFVD